MSAARNRSLRLLLAHAEGNVPAAQQVLDEAAADPDGGLTGLVVALCDAANANAAALSPTDWIDQLRLLAIAEEVVTDE